MISFVLLGELATYENIGVSHQEKAETRFGTCTDNFDTVMKANEAYGTVAQCTALETQRNEAYGKFDSPKQIRSNQFDTDNNVDIGMEANEAYNTISKCNTADTRRNEAYGMLDSAEQYEVGYATVT